MNGAGASVPASHYEDRMTKQFLDFDPMSGLRSFHEYDEASDTTIISYDQPNEGAILDRNKALANEGAAHYKNDKEFWHAAHVPNIVISKWLTEEGIDFYDKDHWPAVRQKLNSSEYAYLRTGKFVI